MGDGSGRAGWLVLVLKVLARTGEQARARLKPWMDALDQSSRYLPSARVLFNGSGLALSGAGDGETNG